MNASLLTADWIWTGQGFPFPGEMEIHGSQISQVRRIRDVRSSPARDAHSHARASSFRILLPGFVNAHAHLDLTLEPADQHLRTSFPEWLLSVRDRRLAEGEEGLARAARAGVARSLASGTTTIVDYDARGHAAAALAGSPMRRVLLKEIIAMEDRSAALRGSWESYLAECDDAEREVRGLAPHAPYSVHRQVLCDTLALAVARRAPWSMHVAEQPFEAQFLASGKGAFEEFFRAAGIALEGFPLPGCAAVGYLRELQALGAQPLLVHANYLSEEEIDLLAEAGAAVVFCPRSHAWFRHAEHPLARLLDAGVRVALGTDGLISNGELSILEEMRAARRAFPRVSAVSILRMGTVTGHAALGGRFGSGRLAAGEPADVVLLEVDGHTLEEDPLETLLDQDSSVRVLGVWIAGECVVQNQPHESAISTR